MKEIHTFFITNNNQQILPQFRMFDTPFHIASKLPHNPRLRNIDNLNLIIIFHMQNIPLPIDRNYIIQVWNCISFLVFELFAYSVEYLWCYLFFIRRDVELFAYYYPIVIGICF